MIASIASTVAVLPALVPAAILTYLYTNFLNAILDGPDWYPEVVDQLALIWFPEFLRGIAAGAIAIAVTAHFLPRADIRIAAIAASTFWLGTISTVALFSFFVLGVTQDHIGVAANAFGLLLGLWIKQLNDGD